MAFGYVSSLNRNFIVLPWSDIDGEAGKMLSEYKRKRSFKDTPEPSGSTSARSKSKRAKDKDLTFVIQKHAARRLHYDFRLEIDGVLVSFAVPKGPSEDPTEKRLAVMTEDHPMEYASFEGTIPPKQYGAGKVEIWDEGTYSPDENGEFNWGDKEHGNKRMQAGLKKGKLSFTLKGKRLKGSWTLVRMKTDDAKPPWLLIKHKEEPRPAQENSAPKRGKRTISSKKVRSRKGIALKEISPMLATLTESAFTRDGWSFEPKFDGYRVISYVANGNAQLRSRNGIDMTAMFPEVAEALSASDSSFILDGEMVAFDEKGHPSFQTLQQAYKEKKKPARIVYFVFDILQFENTDLVSLPLVDRRKALVRLFKKQFVAPSLIQRVEDLGSDGETAYQAALENGMEGVVAKKLDSTYQAGNRSKSWLKVKATSSDEFLICGYVGGKGARKNTFASLILGERDKAGELIHRGNVGTGFSDAKLKNLLKLMKPLVRKTSPFGSKEKGIFKGEKITWVKPSLVAEVKFAERTQGGMLRAPVFMRLRDDIDADEIMTESKSEAGTKAISKVKAKTKPASKSKAVTKDLPGLAFSNLDKVLWPGTKQHKVVSKRDYLHYLEAVAPVILPHLKDRMLTLVRYPNGINGMLFYQKHWEKNPPDFVESVYLPTKHGKKDEKFLVCNNESTLLWLAQIADLEIHTSHTRVSEDFDHPDYMVFDLDPYLYSGKEAAGAEPELHKMGFVATVKAARHFKDILDELGLRSFVKTSGKTGLHIFVPLVLNIDYDTVRDVAQKICATVLKRYPKLVTMDWAVKKRPGKVFLDHNMNARGKSLASIYSPRAVAGAFVSMPLDWDELDDVYPTDFNVYTVPGLIAESGDKWKKILDPRSRNDLRLIFAVAKRKAS